MQPLQRLIAADGYEVMLFPLEYLNISQDEYGPYSHQDILAMDFLGWNSLGRVYNCPYYAPCSCNCIASTDASANNRIWQSVNKVHLADGSLDYVTWVVAHDNNPPAIGSSCVQGQLMGHTGTAGNVTGDHLHINIAKGQYANWEQVPPSYNWQLRNSIHIYDACFVNDTTIINGEGHTWLDWTGPIPPTPSQKRARHFPWVLYSRKFRTNKR